MLLTDLNVGDIFRFDEKYLTSPYKDTTKLPFLIGADIEIIDIIIEYGKLNIYFNPINSINYYTFGKINRNIDGIIKMVKLSEE